MLFRLLQLISFPLSMRHVGIGQSYGNTVLAYFCPDDRRSMVCLWRASLCNARGSAPEISNAGHLCLRHVFALAVLLVSTAGDVWPLPLPGTWLVPMGQNWLFFISARLSAKHSVVHPKVFFFREHFIEIVVFIYGCHVHSVRVRVITLL
jgi:hypothetical protein